MISNLPLRFPLKKLDDFSFGDVDGKSDELLANHLCICRIQPVNEFLKGKKSIIIGERGSGKTALFRLIKDGILSFNKTYKGEKDLILPIEEDLQYKSIKEQIVEVIKLPLADESVKYRGVWEVFLMYRILSLLKHNFNVLPESIKQDIQEVEELFGLVKRKLSLTDLFLSLKFTAGMKLDTASGSVVPNFYGSVEATNSGDKNARLESEVVLNIDKYKNDIQSFLEASNLCLYILIDKLDEFVIKESYDIQKHVLHGLLKCERSYNEYNRLKLKIFIRNDLFRKLDFDELGYEKVESKIIHLRWSNIDIRKFIAQRIAYNLFKTLGIDRFEITIDEEKLYISKDSANLMDFDSEQKDGLYIRIRNYLYDLSLKSKGMKFLYNVGKYTKNYPKRFSRDTRESRIISFKDEINRQIITSIFPRRIRHATIHGTNETIDLMTFVGDHFCLNTNNTTPRIMIIFLEKTMSYVQQYYRDNPDTAIALDENNEYPLIKKDIIAKAYNDLRTIMWDAFSKISSKWEQWFNLFRAKKKKKVTFTYLEIKGLLGDIDDAEFADFVAFLIHIGYLKCEQPHLRLNERTYSLPVLFMGLR